MPSPVRGYTRSFFYWRKQRNEKEIILHLWTPKHAQKCSKSHTFWPKKPIILQIELIFSFDEVIFPRIILLRSAYFTFLYDF